MGLVETTFKKASEAARPHLVSSPTAEGSLRIVQGCSTAPSGGDAVWHGPCQKLMDHLQETS